MDENKFKSPSYLRVYKYLKQYSRGANLDTFTASVKPMELTDRVSSDFLQEILR